VKKKRKNMMILSEDSHSRFPFINLMCRYYHYIKYYVHFFQWDIWRHQVCLQLLSVHISADVHYVKVCKVPRRRYKNSRASSQEVPVTEMSHPI
jgi:hypothetical protein